MGCDCFSPRMIQNPPNFKLSIYNFAESRQFELMAEEIEEVLLMSDERLLFSTKLRNIYVIDPKNNYEIDICYECKFCPKKLLELDDGGILAIISNSLYKFTFDKTFFKQELVEEAFNDGEFKLISLPGKRFAKLRDKTEVKDNNSCPIIIYDTKPTLKVIATLAKENDLIDALFDKTRNALLTYELCGKILVWDLNNFTQISELKYNPALSKLEFFKLPDVEKFITIGEGKHVQLVELDTWKEDKYGFEDNGILKEGIPYITSNIIPMGNNYYLTGIYGHIAIVDPNKKDIVMESNCHFKDISKILRLEENQYLTVALDGTAKLWTISL